MAELAHASGAEHRAPTGRISVPLVVAIGLLVGFGLLGAAYWLITFSWLWFLSFGPLVVGSFLLFTRLTGSDHA